MINVELMAWLEAVVLATYWGEENVPNCEMSQLGYSIFLRRKFYDTFKKKVFTFYAYKSAYIYYNNLMIKLGYLVYVNS